MTPPGDDDETPPRGKPRPGSHWGDSQRALASQTRRRLEQSRPHPPVVVRDDDAITAPLDLLLDGDVDPDDAAAISRLRSNSSDPYEQLWRLTKGFTREKERERSASRQIETEVLSAMREHDKAMGSLKVDVRDLKSGWRSVKAVVITVLVAALGSLGTGIGLMISRAEAEGESRIRMQRLEQDVQQLLHDEHAVRYSPAPAWAHDPPKDKP